MGAGRIVGSVATAMLVGLGFLAACGGDDDAAPPAGVDDGGSGVDTGLVAVDAGPTETDVCKAYVQAFCDRSTECGLASASCAASLALCPDYVFGKGTARSLGDVIACTATQRQQPCGEIAAGIMPGCAMPGTLSAGAACNFGAQCASFACANNGPGACGHCAVPSTDGGCDATCDGKPSGTCVVCKANERCTTDGACVALVAAKELAAGDVCQRDGTTGVCVSPLRCLAGAPGDDRLICRALPAAGQPCLLDPRTSLSVCATGHCGGDVDGPATCTDAPSAEDARCARNEDCEGSLVCSLTGGYCVKPASDGTLCPIIPATSSARATCARTSVCKAVPSAGDLEGKCTPAVSAGEPCTPSTDACIGGTSCRTPSEGAAPRCLPGARAALGESCAGVTECAPNALCTAGRCALAACQ